MNILISNKHILNKSSQNRVIGFFGYFNKNQKTGLFVSYELSNNNHGSFSCILEGITV